MTLPPHAPDFRPWADELRQRARQWMQGAFFAEHCPEGTALWFGDQPIRFATLELQTSRWMRLLHDAGLRAGDGLVLMSRNRPEFIEVFVASMRLGLRLTPVNPQLTPPEVEYILQDSQARGFVHEQREDIAHPPGVAAWALDTPALHNALRSAGQAPAPAPACGQLMVYTSGTTGRPKGVWRREPEFIEPQYEGSFAAYQPGDVQLCAGPAYHSAPLLFDVRWPLASGVPIVLLPRWDALAVLQAVSRHRVTHAHFVPTMFARLLALPAAQREAFELGSLRYVVHGAAPCPVEVKRAMIEWWGPILTEYYAATEGGHGVNVNSHDWLRRPGTVGRLHPALGHRIVDADGLDAAPGEVGRIYFKAPETGRFEYFGDPEKTARAYADGWFTLGDMGRVDSEGWLYLTGRDAETIISGGVNIYPREVDDALRSHPAVADVCTVGAPDAEWGERVVSVVVPRPGHPPTPELEEALKRHAASGLAPFKRPRGIEFRESLPYTGTGKLMRQAVRQTFWSESGRSL
ncbi:MAG: AMP-binding protein [Rubrivivax sp.]|jgi:long-chain acyl-CoA synthetase